MAHSHFYRALIQYRSLALRMLTVLQKKKKKKQDSHKQPWDRGSEHGKILLDADGRKLRKSFCKRCHHNKTLHESQNFHTWRWAVPALLGQPSGSIHLLWVLWATDLCSWSFSMFTRCWPWCHANYSNSGKKQITELSFEPCGCYLHIFNTWLCLRRYCFKNNVLRKLQLLSPRDGVSEGRARRGSPARRQDTNVLGKDTFVSVIKQARRVHFPPINANQKSVCSILRLIMHGKWILVFIGNPPKQKFDP